MAFLRVYGLDDHYTDWDDMYEDEWEDRTEGGLDPSYSTTAGRFGGTSITVPRVTGGTPTVSIQMPDQPSTLYFAAAVKRGYVGEMTADGIVVEFRGNGVRHWRLNFDIDSGKVLVYILGVLQGDFFISGRKWHYMECKMIIHDTTGEITIQVDEIEVFSQTGIDTANGTNIYVDQIRFVGNAGDDLHFEWDDLVLHTEADFIGDYRIDTLNVTADGSTTAFTRSAGATNVENVDEQPGPNGDADYVESTTAAHQELYGCENMTGTVDTIHTVNVKAYSKKTDAGSRSTRLLCRNNVTTVQGAVQVLLTDYEYQNELFDVDPDGGGAWTEADVNAMEIGVENV